MSKKKLLRNSPLYLLTAANIIYAVQHGFNWLTWFAIGLTLIVFVWDIVEVFKRGKKQKDPSLFSHIFSSVFYVMWFECGTPKPLFFRVFSGLSHRCFSQNTL